MAELCFCEDSEIKPHEHCGDCHGILTEDDAINYCRECLNKRQQKRYQKQKETANATN